MNEDQEILAGRFPVEPAGNTAPAPPGHSYYWDCRAEGLPHEEAVRKAARQMGASLASLRATQR